MVTYSSEVGDGHSAISDCDKVSDNVTWLFELLGRIVNLTVMILERAVCVELIAKRIETVSFRIQRMLQMCAADSFSQNTELIFNSSSDSLI